MHEQLIKERRKDGIPGVDDIFVGDDKVYKVMAGTSQIWLG